MIIQTQTIGQMLAEATQTLAALDGVNVGEPDHGNPQSPEHKAVRARQAEASRTLLYIQSVLATASALVGVEYWALRGYDNGLVATIDEDIKVMPCSPSS